MFDAAGNLRLSVGEVAEAGGHSGERSFQAEQAEHRVDRLSRDGQLGDPGADLLIVRRFEQLAHGQSFL